jgi:hypothetical protein
MIHLPRSIHAGDKPASQVAADLLARRVQIDALLAELELPLGDPRTSDPDIVERRVSYYWRRHVLGESVNSISKSLGQGDQRSHIGDDIKIAIGLLGIALELWPGRSCHEWSSCAALTFSECP